MFRTALLQSTRCFAQAGVRAAQPVVRSAAIRSPFITSQIATPATSLSAVRCYASGSGLGKEEVTGRIVDLLKNFDKVRGGGSMVVEVLDRG
jgi:NADH dehydrogenase (ubiquinone) 1 alpha/beta subcomplex 1